MKASLSGAASVKSLHTWDVSSTWIRNVQFILFTCGGFSSYKLAIVGCSGRSRSRSRGGLTVNS